ncbi:MAG TPA: hypothetical protein VEC36_11945, partial [Patescibacteria group bacterium]|nr:hypothetical protein [Patescibacteria group bacterium]
NISEIESRRLRFLEIIGELQANDFGLWETINEQNLLKIAQTEGEKHAKELQTNTILTYESAVKNQFNNPDDQRLSLDTGNVVSESLIVDLMNTFFPISSKVKSLESYIQNSPPRKIVIIIDTFEKISGAINDWLLESLLPYCFKKRFGDFRSYDSPYLQPEFAVSQFLDFRFLIAGREPVSLTDKERRWDRYRPQMSEIHLSGFNEAEIVQFLKSEGVPGEPNADNVKTMTEGLPYLVSLWADAQKAQRFGAEKTFLSTLAEQRIFWYKTDEQKEWIRAAAFCEWFDADTLRCFPKSNANYREAFTYLRNTSELTRPNPAKPTKLMLHPVIGSCVREATIQESEDVARQYLNIWETFKEMNSILGDMDPGEREIARNLAYFPRFDEDFALKEFFASESSHAGEFVKAHTELFKKNEFTWSVKPDVEKVLTNYNKLVDRADFTEKNGSVRDIWARRKSSLESAIKSNTDEISALRNEIIVLEGEMELKRQMAGAAQGRFMEAENEAILLKRRWNYQLANRDIAVARMSFFVAAICAVLGYFIPDIILAFDPVAAEETANLFQKVLFGISIIFSFAFFIFLFRLLYVRSQKAEMRRMQENREAVEARSARERAEMQTLAQESESASKRMLLAKQRILELSAENERLQKMLTESYV